jgi:hypothetical protein
MGGLCQQYISVTELLRVSRSVFLKERAKGTAGKARARSILTLIKRDDTGFSVPVALYDDIM